MSKKYTWSLRETTEQGEPLVNVIDHGISRMKHASDCYAVLLKELKIAANNNLFRIMVLANDVNLFYTKPLVKHPDGRVASIEEMTLARAFLKLLKNDWVSLEFVQFSFTLPIYQLFCLSRKMAYLLELPMLIKVTGKIV